MQRGDRELLRSGIVAEQRLRDPIFLSNDNIGRISIIFAASFSKGLSAGVKFPGETIKIRSPCTGHEYN